MFSLRSRLFQDFRIEPFEVRNSKNILGRSSRRPLPSIRAVPSNQGGEAPEISGHFGCFVPSIRALHDTDPPNLVGLGWLDQLATNICGCTLGTKQFACGRTKNRCYATGNKYVNTPPNESCRRFKSERLPIF